MQEITGIKFNMLTPIKIIGKYKDGSNIWLCKCDCGNETKASLTILKNNHKKSCGCLLKKAYLHLPQKPKVNLEGMKFGRWTVLSLEKEIRKPKTLHRYWNCVCECGNKKQVLERSLLKGVSQSCGCLHKEIVSQKASIHKKSNSRIYRIWHNMTQRCNNPKSTGYEHYGGKSIKVCDEWNKDANAFIEWALSNGYKDNLTIDRIDVNGNYEPSNCRWADMIIQANNTTINHRVVANGANHTITEWARITEISPNTIYSRVRKGMSWEEAVVLPKRNVNVKEKGNGIKC